jgi:predicted Zn-dependent protease
MDIFSSRSCLLPGSVLLCVAVACSINPATGKRELVLYSEADEIQIGRENDASLVESLGMYPDDGLQEYVQALGERLAENSERPHLPWTFRVVDDPVVNAFALPGGYIYITRGILAYLNTESELAGVVGHEIGHVTARHGVSQMSRAQLTNYGLVIGSAASEDVARWAGVAGQGMGLLFLKYSRDDEKQSDDLGLRYLLRAGYDPRPMADVYGTLKAVAESSGAGRIPSLLSTHPDPGNRRDRILSRIDELEVDPQGVGNHATLAAPLRPSLRTKPRSCCSRWPRAVRPMRRSTLSSKAKGSFVELRGSTRFRESPARRPTSPGRRTD